MHVIYVCLAGSLCFLGLHIASPLLELRIVQQLIALAHHEMV